MTAPAAAVRRDLQGLRALAVLAVVASHLTGWPSGGFVGVDVFLVLSGFLVTGILLRDLDATRAVHLARFFARRIRRLLPAALVVLAATVGAAFLVFPGVRAEGIVADAVSALGIFSNWRFGLEGRDYFAATAVSPLQHFWSLSVEEQFSLIWPVVVLLGVLCLPLARRRGASARAVVAVIAGLVAAASAIVAAVQTPVDASLAYFSTFTRAGELAVGALLATAVPVVIRMPGPLRAVASWAGVGVVVASMLVIDPGSAFPAPWALLPVAGAALVIAGGVGGDPRHRHLFVLTARPVVMVGDLSYSLYLWHLPVIVFAGAVLAPGPWTTAITALAMAVLTVATYLGVEQPLHRSPWLTRGRTETPDAVGAEASSTAATTAVASPDAPSSAALPPAAPSSAAAPSAAAPSAPAPRAAPNGTRPAGWVPGQRYYPGARAAIALTDPVRSVPAQPVAATVTSVTAAAVAEPAPVSAPASDTTWASWRERFAPRITLAATTLVIGAGATVLAVLVAYGAPALPSPPPVTVAAPVDDTHAALTALQTDLAAATAATSWPDLHPSLDEVMRASSAANPAHDCFTPELALDAVRCTWGSADAPHHMYLVGDSSAMAYAPAFRRMAEESGGVWRITTVGMYGCRFTDVLIESRDPSVTAGCAARKSDVAAMIAAAPADLLVVSNAYTLARTIDGRDLGAREVASSVASEVAGWAPPTRTVYLAPPPHGADIARCASSVSGPSACAAAVDDVWNQMQAAAEAQAGSTGDAAINALPFSCWQGVCPAFAGDVPMRYDDTHITPAFAERLAPILRDELSTRGLY